MCYSNRDRMLPEGELDALLELFQHHSRRLALLTIAVLVILMSLSVAHTVLFFIDNLAGDGLAVAPSAPSRSATTPSNVNLSQLNLFGAAAAPATPTNVDAPETNLNLELDGVFTAADPDDSSAIIAESGKSGILYQIGDRLPGNAVLNAVFDDHILIKRGDRFEKLMFSDSTTQQPFKLGTPTAANASRGSLIRSIGGLPSNRLQEIRDRIEQRSEQISSSRSEQQSPGASIRDYVDDYREQIKSDPNAVLDKLGVAPVNQGEADGYRIGGNVPQQFLSQAGLQQGDVILSVNGTPVGVAMNDRNLVDQAMAAGRVRVEVQRGSRKFFLTVPIPKQN